MPDAAQQPVIRAEPDGYDMAKLRLMGRQSAGHGFLRAAVAARGSMPMRGLAREEGAAKGFGAIVRAIDPAAEIELLPYHRMGMIGQVGPLYLADATVAAHARRRLRHGHTAYSLCGVTHTTASAETMEEIAGLLTAPVAPWDALVCTSAAVVETVRRVHEKEADYLRWRFGAGAAIPRPTLARIPLGVHCEDFEFSAAERAAARAAFGLAADDVAAIFVGRLSFHAKAHPFAMYRGLEAAAARSGRRLVLLLCGWAFNEGIGQAFTDGAAMFAPNVTTRIVEGRKSEGRRQAWAAADIFVSLSDNIQETFGLTPVEAMAAGLPVVVTDWNGYRDTVRPDIDGVRIPTFAPAAGMGEPLARGLEDGSLSYDRYCWAAASATAVDLAALSDALSRLAADEGLRSRLGEAGRRRARETFDWSVVYRDYQRLWTEQEARRMAAVAAEQDAPPLLGARLDPFYAFGHYPTTAIGPTTRLGATAGTTLAACRQVLAHPLFRDMPAAPDLLLGLYGLAQQETVTVADASRRLQASLPAVGRAAGMLAKAGMLHLG